MKQKSRSTVNKKTSTKEPSLDIHPEMSSTHETHTPKPRLTLSKSMKPVKAAMKQKARDTTIKKKSVNEPSFINTETALIQRGVDMPPPKMDGSIKVRIKNFEKSKMTVFFSS